MWDEDFGRIQARTNRTVLAFDLLNGEVAELIAPDIIAVGCNDEFIVVKQNPCMVGDGTIDRTTTNYFIVKLIPEPTWSERRKGVVGPSLAARRNGIQGPMSKEEFERLAVTIKLPDFSKFFPEVK